MNQRKTILNESHTRHGGESDCRFDEISVSYSFRKGEKDRAKYAAFQVLEAQPTLSPESCIFPWNQEYIFELNKASINTKCHSMKWSSSSLGRIWMFAERLPKRKRAKFELILILYLFHDASRLSLYKSAVTFTKTSQYTTISWWHYRQILSDTEANDWKEYLCDLERV